MKEDIEAIAEKYAKEKSIVAEYVGTYDWESNELIKFNINSAKQDFIAGYNAANENHIEVYKWLLGYYDFPDAPTDGRPKYWFRTHLRNHLKDMGIEIDPPSNDGFPIKSTPPTT